MAHEVLMSRASFPKASQAPAPAAAPAPADNESTSRQAENPSPHISNPSQSCCVRYMTYGLIMFDHLIEFATL